LPQSAERHERNKLIVESEDIVMEMKFVNSFGEETTVVFKKGKYLNNNNLYVGAYSVDEDGYLEPYCNVTVNFEEKLEDGMAYIDDNNADMNLLKALIDAGHMTYMFKSRHSGFCNYLLFYFSEEFLESLEEM
jgi:hypothetical protein